MENSKGPILSQIPGLTSKVIKCVISRRKNSSFPLLLSLSCRHVYRRCCYLLLEWRQWSPLIFQWESNKRSGNTCDALCWNKCQCQSPPLLRPLTAVVREARAERECACVLVPGRRSHRVCACVREREGEGERENDRGGGRERVCVCMCTNSGEWKGWGAASLIDKTMLLPARVATANTSITKSKGEYYQSLLHLGCDFLLLASLSPGWFGTTNQMYHPLTVPKFHHQKLIPMAFQLTSTSVIHMTGIAPVTVFARPVSVLVSYQVHMTLKLVNNKNKTTKNGYTPTCIWI